MAKSKSTKKKTKFPHQPGVYLMKDQRRRVIYIGKARDLQQRISHYSAGATDLDHKTKTLMSRVKKIDYLATDSEIDALLLEARLVRDTKPKYNVNLKDDKTFPLVAISRADDFPRVFITRARGKPDCTYYGPFTQASDLRSAFKSLQRIFKFRSCRQKLTLAKLQKASTKNRPCLLYHIKQCFAPCISRINKPGYQDLIKSLEQFLTGHKDKLITRLTKQMKQASQEHDYERAALWRDQINALQGLSGQARMAQFYEGALASLTPSAKMQHLQKLLKLSHLLRRVEGVDISDIKGREAVGSLVCFIDGEPFKDGYRRYKIRTVPEGEADDYQRMAEVIKRRFVHQVSKEGFLPDILLIDGGAGHLSVIGRVLKELNVKPPIILGMAKPACRQSGREGDHLYQLGRKNRIVWPASSPGVQFLRYVRDEAHRFAQRYHHYLRGKQLYH